MPGVRKNYELSMYLSNSVAYEIMYFKIIFKVNQTY